DRGCDDQEYDDDRGPGDAALPGRGSGRWWCRRAVLLRWLWCGGGGGLRGPVRGYWRCGTRAAGAAGWCRAAGTVLPRLGCGGWGEVVGEPVGAQFVGGGGEVVQGEGVAGGVHSGGGPAGAAPAVLVQQAAHV